MALDAFSESFYKVFAEDLARAAHCEEAKLKELAINLAETVDACRGLVYDIERFHEQISSNAPLTELYSSATDIAGEIGEHIPSHGKKVAKILQDVRILLFEECRKHGMSEDDFFDEHKRNVERHVKERSNERRRHSAE